MYQIKKEKENIFIVIPEFNFEISYVDKIRELRHRVQEEIENVENPIVILDFKNISYIDSTGLGNILRMFELLKKKKGKLVITSLQLDVENIFKITTLDSLIPIFENVETALDELKFS